MLAAGQTTHTPGLAVAGPESETTSDFGETTTEIGGGAVRRLDELRRGAKVLAAEELSEAEAFLRWMADNNFTFLGYGCYELMRDKAGDQLRRDEGSARGVLAKQASTPVSRSFAALPEAVRREARKPTALVITKANTRSTVHRPVYLDYVGVRRFAKDGKVIGEREWQSHRATWLPTDADKAHVKSLQEGVTEPGKMAGWVAPPSTGIHQKPIDFEYVKI